MCVCVCAGARARECVCLCVCVVCARSSVCLRTLLSAWASCSECTTSIGKICGSGMSGARFAGPRSTKKKFRILPRSGLCAACG